MTEEITTEPRTTLPSVHALPAPIIDVSTPDNWVIIVRPASAHFPDAQGKFGAEYWTARPAAAGEELGEAADAGDVSVKNVEMDPGAEVEDLIKNHRDVTEGMVGSGHGLEFDAAFFDTVMAAAAAAIKAARIEGAQIDEHLAEYIELLAREADTMREGLPPWADVVFRRDALEAMKRVGCTNTKVAFIETDEQRRRVDVEMTYRGEFYEVSYEPDFEHDQERQDVILQAIRDLPARAREAAAAAAPTE